MKSIIREFLNIPRTEQRGIFILILLILIFQTIRIGYPYFQDERYSLNEKEANALAEWIMKKEINERMTEKLMRNNPPKNTSVLNCFPFNPNLLDAGGWQKLGYSRKQGESAIKYINHGGKFLIKKDLRKLFFITEQDYHILEKWIMLPDEKPGPRTNSSKTNPFPIEKPNKKFPVDLNTADSVRLLDLRGIGPYWASRIIRQRNRLGGFFSPEQLMEMKGFPDSIFQRIKPFIITDSSKLIKIPVNTISIDELQKHPYGWYGVGKSIVNFRAKHGPFRQPDDLRKILSLKAGQLEKLLPYLSFE